MSYPSDLTDEQWALLEPVLLQFARGVATRTHIAAAIRPRDIGTCWTAIAHPS
jgi:hypothetical protein